MLEINGDIYLVHGPEDSIVKDLVLFKLISRFKTVTIKILIAFSCGNWQAGSEIIWT